jgi:hypothetical protein
MKTGFFGGMSHGLDGGAMTGMPLIAFPIQLTGLLEG